MEENTPAQARGSGELPEQAAAPWAHPFPGNLALLLDAAAQRNPGARGLGFSDRVVSFPEALDLARRTTHALKRLGLRRGDRILLCAQNSLDFVRVAIAAWRAGAVIVPLNPAIRHFELQHVIDETRPRIAVCSAITVPHVLQACHESPGFPSPLLVSVDRPAVGAMLLADLDMSVPAPACEEVPADHAAMIVYTSAMDGYALGAEVSHGSLFHDALCCAQDCYARRDAANDAAVSLLPLFHLQGFTCGFLVPLIGAVTTYLLPVSHKATEVVDLMEREAVTQVTSVSAVFYTLMGPLAAKPGVCARLINLTSGGFACPPDLLDAYASRLGLRISEGYGLTECSPVVTWNGYDRPPRFGTAGTALPCCEIRITDETGAAIPAGRDGEVRVRGLNLFNGYYGRPEATRRVLADGWLRTGDLGHLDADGYLTLTGLKKDMINVFGLKVYPKEVERILSHHPDIRAACVYEDRQDRYGPLVACELRVKHGCRLNETDFRRWCRHNISAYKIPRRFHIHD